MKQIRSEIRILAPPERVWEVLVDFSRYGEWNPFIYAISGEAVMGSTIHINLRTPAGKERSYKPVITRVDRGSELRWAGKSIFLNGEHILLLELQDKGHTRFVQTEIFGGPLAAFFGKRTDDDISAGLDQMNQALKRRVEAGN